MQVGQGLVFHIGINRNIVECKLFNDGVYQYHKGGINRNIVECKFAYMIFCHRCKHTELIETLWNVNSITAITCPDRASRINRNIVECKLCRPRPCYLLLCELIETLWNVNDYMNNAVYLICERELIETLWNVNFQPVYIRLSAVLELIETLWNVNSFLKSLSPGSI